MVLSMNLKIFFIVIRLSGHLKMRRYGIFKVDLISGCCRIKKLVEYLTNYTEFLYPGNYENV